MNSDMLLVVAGAVVLIGFALLSFQMARLNRAIAGPKGKKGKDQTGGQPLQNAAIEEVSHLFNDEFREELRNRGRLHFEKIIAENAMFLKQDLDMTIAQINEHLKQEIGGKLDSEFEAYARAMKEAQELALSALQKSATAVETQRLEIADAFKQDLTSREAGLLKNYEDNMAKIIEQYLLQAISDQIDLKSQLPLILAQMEANKKDIMNDMRL